MSLAEETGGIITRWLFRLLLFLALLGVGVYEAGAVVVATVQSDGVAIDAARVAADTYRRSGSTREARERADALARQRGATVVDVGLSSDGSRISVTVEKPAATLIIHRIGALEDRAIARRTQDASVT